MVVEAIPVSWALVGSAPAVEAAPVEMEDRSLVPVG